MMDKRLVLPLLGALLAVALVAGTGCRRVPIEQVDGEVSQDTYELEIGSARAADVRVRMGVGELTLESDAESGTLVAADFEYRPEAWKPVVDADEFTSDETAVVEVRQPSVDGLKLGGLGSDGAVRNAWDLALAPGVPIDLSVELGAGEAKLRLGDALVRTLQVSLGAGDATIDLSGEWTEDLEADIQAGVGELTLIVPEGVGVRVWGQNEGIGDYVVEGLTRDGEYYVNEEYDENDVTLDIRLQRGVGEVNVRTAAQ